MDLLNVYIEKFPFSCDSEIYPQERKNEILSVNNQDVRNQKFYVWKLLEKALKQSYYIDIKDVTFTRENGKWECEDCFFSLSHSGNIVCVAVSDKIVGIDIEKIDLQRFSRLKKEKILDVDELNIFKDKSEQEQSRIMNKLWCVKESVFKMSDEKVFKPSKIDSQTVPYNIIECKNGDASYFLCVASEIIDTLKCYVGEGLVLGYSK